MLSFDELRMLSFDELRMLSFGWPRGWSPKKAKAAYANPAKPQAFFDKASCPNV